MNILLVKAHPMKNSLCNLFTEKTTSILEAMGHNVTLEDLYKNDFNPVLSAEERSTYYKENYD